MSKIETDSLPRKAVEGRGGRRPAVATERISAKRIDGDQEDVLTRDGMEIGLECRAMATGAKNDEKKKP
jgi:hypothetical protein